MRYSWPEDFESLFASSYFGTSNITLDIDGEDTVFCELKTIKSVSISGIEEDLISLGRDYVQIRMKFHSNLCSSSICVDTAVYGRVVMPPASVWILLGVSALQVAVVVDNCLVSSEDEVVAFSRVVSHVMASLDLEDKLAVAVSVELPLVLIVTKVLPIDSLESACITANSHCAFSVIVVVHFARRH